MKNTPINELAPETIGRVTAKASLARDLDLFSRKNLHPVLKAKIADHTSDQIGNIARSLQNRDKKKFIRGTKDPQSGYQKASRVYVNIMRNLNKEDSMKISEWKPRDPLGLRHNPSPGQFVSPNDPKKGCWALQRKGKERKTDNKSVSERILEKFHANRTNSD
jgi:hypothetical protein